jgi:hypothetical protein
MFKLFWPLITFYLFSPVPSIISHDRAWTLPRAAKFTGYASGSVEPRQFTIGIRLQMFSPIFTAINLTNFSPTLVWSVKRRGGEKDKRTPGE